MIIELNSGVKLHHDYDGDRHDVKAVYDDGVINASIGCSFLDHDRAFNLLSELSKDDGDAVKQTLLGLLGL